ncbi:pimeloyl-ACP methyl ester carboxylesterase [Peteryoungia aggregata LMG 23059]|uniref:Pimeloyl-ACP methyl ester carboxylesterase n=1 Tax=Peteryoungia aggregata LMG 23059 TaxID=1368425 RepID=A0ABU0G2H3_9HYPH|nr:alpha/beta hydrolase [Peteryoungia aggregata]MDQ0419473.1 pimeloyl-ACP methyl ester carboxylesterase [Peteryoungia aggregata LMG 23059]
MFTIPPRSRTASGTAYAAIGRGEPLVLIHGVGMKLEAWTPQMQALSDRFEVIAADLPGHGESLPLPAGAGLGAFVARFVTFIEELGQGPVSVAGHSMGALIAGGLAAEASQRISRVALLNGVHRRDEAAREAVTERAAEIMTGAFDREAPLRRWFGDGGEHEAAYALSRQLLAEVDQQGYATAYGAFATGDTVYADCWPQVRCPALFLTGEGDLNSTPEMACAMAAAAADGRAVVIAGHRHMVNLTAPDAVNAALSEWMARTCEEARHDA